ncbi:MAG: RNA polymerase factor sigma-54 [Ferruginibacter sp.]|nr:RNA polymerase factor sigma-54 [Bacteroidota bacterium]MBX2918089.1 RNA polymerase factor sigma-54 [Ferruginibacter sp.]MCB0709689.1 RNA polymerase factor sigma-54 [Chitinophagaceae bacterium]MCC7379532.1 RNA polymerase factor sigma-54 [Chitinophagaceae bacterium]
MALSQGLYQKQLQKLSPQQIQLMKLLQVPTALLEERIKEEIEENPALEEAEEGHETEYEETVDEFSESEDNEMEMDGSAEEYENIDISEYVSEGDDEISDYKLKDSNYPEVDENRVIPIKVERGFNEIMMEQLDMLTLDEHQKKVALQIIGNLDDDGYLRRDFSSIVDDLAFRQNIQTSEEEIAGLVQQIQQFDPPGIAARNLQECLLLQLERMRDAGKNVDMAIRVLEKYFDEFTKKHYEKIQRSLNLSDDDLRDIINQVIKLNPKPAGNVGDSNKSESYIVPDFFIYNNAGKLELTLNSKNAPDLRISEGYREMLKEYDRGSKKDKRQKEAVIFIKQKIDAAKWFIDAIKQRYNTLMNTMEAIMNYQHDFFISGDETDLRPMILKYIAEATNLDISTVSRVANSKFVQTEFGTYRLKFFFSESLQTDSGEEVSTREVKKILSDIIEAEDKKHPYSDERLTEMLQEKGYNIARRTVAKYREQLNISVARLRKEL